MQESDSASLRRDGSRFVDGQRLHTPALTVERLAKNFGVTRALRSVDMTVQAGQIHGLLGGNGSGKSTLIKILAGVYEGEPGGTITIGGEAIRSDAMSPTVARERGLRFVHQNRAVFPSLTVAENMAIGGAAGFPRRGCKIRWSELESHTRALLERFEIDVRPDDRVGDLRAAEQTMIAIARALQDEDVEGSGSDAERSLILVLDEPTASLPPHEVEVLLGAVRQYARAGQTILFVSHRIDEVLSTVDAATVLRDGKVIVSRSTEGLTSDDLIEYIVGGRLERVFAEAPPQRRSDTLLEVSNVSGGPLRDVSLSVSPGEVVGIGGLLGSGRTELLRMIFGAFPIESGDIRLDGESLTKRDSGDVMAMGVAYVPEDREADGAFPDLSVQDNLSVAQIRTYWKGLGFDHKRERRDTKQAMDDFSIRAAGPRALFSSLSGGNQQKVVLARWLRRTPRLLLLDEPTQGVDIRARTDVYAAVRRAIEDTDMAVILVTSDLEELAHAADRVLVLHGGRVTAEVRGDDLDSRRLTELVHFANGEAAA